MFLSPSTIARRSQEKGPAFITPLPCIDARQAVYPLPIGDRQYLPISAFSLMSSPSQQALAQSGHLWKLLRQRQPFRGHHSSSRFSLCAALPMLPINSLAYWKAIDAHAAQTTLQSLYPGQDYEDLRSFLARAPFGPRYSHHYTYGQDFPHAATLYTIDNLVKPDFCSYNNSAELLNRLAANVRKTRRQIAFLNGYPSPEWLIGVGAILQIDPEFFKLHLRFRDWRDYHASPSLPSSLDQIIRLKICTVDELRREAIEAKRLYEHDLERAHSCKRGDSIVREYHVLDEKHFVIEQDMSICLSQTDESWSDLSQGPPGPWLTKRDRESVAPWTRFYPVVQHRHRVALTPKAPSVIDPDSPPVKFPQGASLLAEHYAEFLDMELLGQDPFYAITELFRFAASAESLFLATLETKISSETGYNTVSHQKSTLSNLLYFQDILRTHETRLGENIKVIRRRGHCSWPHLSDPDEKLRARSQGAVEALLEDFEYLHQRCRTLMGRCSQGSDIILNAAMLAESKEAKKQAEGLRKLTFVAFFYIPLSFTTSFFGMNFRQLGQESEATGQHSSTVNDLVRGDNEPAKLSLALDRIPVEIQRNIYAYLLDSDSVRQRPNKHYLRSYRFETAILSVNRHIYQISHDVLYRDNIFIVVSCNWKAMTRFLYLHGVAELSINESNVSAFRQHFLRLHIAFPPSFKIIEYGHQRTPPEDSVLASFLLLQDDLDRFVRMLNLLTFLIWPDNGFYSYIIKFRMVRTLPDDLDMHLQKLLLEPFRRLSHGRHGVEMLGRVGGDYWPGLLHDMTFRIRWTRGEAWRLYALMVSFIEEAEEAIKTEDYTAALTRYKLSKRFYDTVLTDNAQIKNLDDKGFDQSCLNLVALCETNVALLTPKFLYTAHAEDGFAWTLEHTKWLDTFTEPRLSPFRRLTLSKLRYYRGVAQFMANNPTAALELLTKALQPDPGNSILERCIAMIRRQESAESGSEDGAIAKGGFGDLYPNPDRDLIRAPDPLYFPSQVIATERAVLCDLGFKGDLLPQIPAARPVNGKLMDRITKALILSDKNKSVSLTAVRSGSGLTVGP
ncbi:MAG: hypothetical protein Q9207_004189 [Kuettlingeria erythrocarpa]